MARRQIHFSRLLDIICGSALEAANTKVQKSAVYEDFKLAKLEENKLRDLIDSNLPTFYVVRVNTVVSELSKGLGLNNFSENAEYVAQQFPSKDKLHTFLHETLVKALNKLPSKPFIATTYTPLNNEYKKLLNTFAKRTTYVGYRRAANTFGSNMRKILKESGVYRISDAQSILANLEQHDFVIVGASFNSTVKAVNDLLNKELRTSFQKSYDIKLKEYNAKADATNRFTIGDYINAGHTAAYSGSGDFIGINMPLAQEKQFLLSGDPKSEGLETAIADLYLNSNNAITFNQNFSAQASTLIDMQFSFTISMPSKFNTATLRTDEVRRIKEYIGDTILPTILEQAISKFKGGILDSVALDSSASPSFHQFLEDLVISNLGGKRTTPVIKSNVASGKKPQAIKTHAIVKANKPTKLKARAGGTKLSPQKLAQTGGVDGSLSNLKNLLDGLLVETIKANMGSGNRRDILNLRTGRFANSVKAESLSRGRQGMVTVYYSYMRNPYATFSQGGAREIPRTRDPKLLISKSIRQIAQQAAVTRLRAVQV